MGNKLEQRGKESWAASMDSKHGQRAWAARMGSKNVLAGRLLGLVIAFACVIPCVSPWYMLALVICLSLCAFGSMGSVAREKCGQRVACAESIMILCIKQCGQ